MGNVSSIDTNKTYIKLKSPQWPSSSQTCQLLDVTLCDFWPRRALEEPCCVSLQLPLGKPKMRLELRTDIKYCAWLFLTRMTCTYFILAGLSVSCVRAFFPGWFSIVPPDRRLRISGSMHAAGVVRTLKWAHRCTSNKISYTLPVCQEEKGLGKKRASLCILIECTLIHPLSLHLFFHLALKRVARLHRFSLHINEK